MKTKTVTLQFSKKNLPDLNTALQKAVNELRITNNSIIINNDTGEVFIEPTEEGFLFSFGMYYGKILAKESETDLLNELEYLLRVIEEIRIHDYFELKGVRKAIKNATT